MVEINHRVGIKAPVSRVYAALSTIKGIAGWWTKQTTGVSKSGGNIDVRFLSHDGKEIGSMNFDVIELDPDKKVHWRFTSGPKEWIGTDVVFTLSKEDDYTIVLFSHKNWRELVEFTFHCSMKWAVFMLSLKELVETGNGKPSPNDVKIDNWN
ncbi:MAG TPA: SRPBCC domain-containing protein [Ignavibacteriaceae bacterium]|nr:SRPBCC domain-containing protein [Ignavibacteriaceae bacterium]